MEITRIFDLLPYYKDKFKAKDDAVAGKVDGEWVKYSIDQYIETANNISYALMKLGVRKGDKIASISNSRPEWNFLDMGILQAGAVHVPIYPTISKADYKYILAHSEVKYVFVSGQDLYRKIEDFLPENTNILDVYSFNKIDGVKHLDQLLDLGRSNADPGALATIKDAVDPHDIATLIYTSGTTGIPKGVLLSHDNIISNVKDVYKVFPLDDTSKGISYLPLCHVFERMVIYVYHILGVSIYYAENLARIADNIREIKPEIFTTVPRLLEKVYDKILDKGYMLKGIKRRLFFWAVNLGLHYEIKGKSPFYKLQLSIADKLVFSKWRAALGGNLRVIVSGGAALQARLARTYTAAGMPVIEGYGLTETSPVIAFNTFYEGGLKFGTVGKPLKHVDVKIAGDGEILCKGPNVMKGYYKDPELTDEVIKEDWFHTGDVGIIVPEGHLKITGRKKDIFKTSLGKYISPALLENKFKESPFIDNLVVCGENQKYAASLIVPDFVHLKSWCKLKDIPYTTNEEMISHPEVKKRYKKEMGHFNSFFGGAEKIQSFELLDHEFSIETGELTANLKIKRRFIKERYKTELEKLFK